jgi:hypothetical protein
MAHFADGAVYAYSGEADRSLVCAGWLAAGYRFRIGQTPTGFLDRLAWLCVNRTERAYRGIHLCDLCIDHDTDHVSILHGGKKHLLGMAEITVSTPSRSYAVPTLVMHYVVVHGYLPPDDLVAAVMGASRDETLSHWSLFVGPYWVE